MYNDDYHHSIDSNPESCLVSIDVSRIISSRISELSWEHCTIFIHIPYNDNIHNINMILFHNIPINIIIPYSLIFHIHSIAMLWFLQESIHRRLSSWLPQDSQAPNATGHDFFSPEGDADPRATGGFNGSLPWLVVVFYVVLWENHRKTIGKWWLYPKW